MDTEANSEYSSQQRSLVLNNTETNKEMDSGLDTGQMDVQIDLAAGGQPLQKDPSEINLKIQGQLFTVKKDVLCQHSDYFRAMFSGNFLEQDKQEIAIDVIDATSMSIILNYIILEDINLLEYPLPIIGKLAMAANFLQITVLIDLLKSGLDSLICVTNWFDIMVIAENAEYTKLETRAATFGLVEFKHVKPEIIPDARRLFWYLANPCLKVDNEAEVFRFGYNWILQVVTCTCTEMVLMILGCLDLRKLNIQDIKEISVLISDSDNSVATKLVACLKMIIDNDIHLSYLDEYENKKRICGLFGEPIYIELMQLSYNSVRRKNLLRPVVPIWYFKDGELEFTPHFVSIFQVWETTGFFKYMEVADKSLWGWSIASWGGYKLVQVCGEMGRGTSRFMRDVKVYDTLRNVWTSHGVLLPKRRHAGVVINGDLLFIIGGVGEFRVTQDTTIIYNLKTNEYREGPTFPDALQSPAVCTYYDTVYAAGQKHIYKYEDLDTTDKWIPVASVDIRANHMIAFKEHIYCSQSFFSQLYRFRPGVDKSLETAASCSQPPAALANVGNSLIIFTRSACGQSRQLIVESFKLPCLHTESFCKDDCGSRVIYNDNNADFTVNDIAGACSLIIDMPSDLKRPLSDYHQRYLIRHPTTYSCAEFEV